MAKLIQQTENTCVLACIAMAVGKTLKDIMVLADAENIDYKEGVTLEDQQRLLYLLGVSTIPYGAPILVAERFYIITCPSLNELGVNHCVYVYWDYSKDTFVVMDPNKGIEGKKYYTYLEDDKEGYKINGYSEVVELIILQDTF